MRAMLMLACLNLAIGQSGVAADPLGTFRFEAIAPGSYEIEIQHEGFKAFTRRMRTGSRPPAPLKIVLALADVRKEITVDAAAAQVGADPGDNLDVVRLDRKSLDNLPIFDQDYIGTMSRFLDAGAIGTGGVTLIEDGVEATGAGVSQSAIQEVKINQNPYSAEFARRRIEIITKPGSPDYHGAFNFLFRDSVFNARDPFSLVRPREQRHVGRMSFS